MKTQHPTLNALGWGVFCACSWTWAIGMYLPSIVGQRYGWAGFLAFLIPNVLGCAGFGYVITSRRMSLEMVERHRPLMLLFSLAAIGFHLIFAAILTIRFARPDGGALAAGAATVERAAATGGLFAFPGDLALLILLGGGVLAVLRDRQWLIAAAVMYAVSLASFGFVGFDGLRHLGAYGEGALPELIWLVPVITAGFLLCPYLDLTFHRARQEAASRHAFGVFGATFTVMLLLTVAIWFDAAAEKPMLLLGHFVGQATFTVGAHMRELREVGRRFSRAAWLTATVGLAALALIVPIAAWMLAGDPLRLAEGIYLRYLALYGLVFPAAVLLFIGPWRPMAPPRRAAIALLIVCLALAPLFEAAFVHRITWTMIVPTAALAGWSLGRRKTARPSERAALRQD